MLFTPQDIQLYEAYANEPNYENLITGRLSLSWSSETAGRHTWPMHARITGVHFFAFGTEFRLTIGEETRGCGIVWDYLAVRSRRKVKYHEVALPIPEDVWGTAKSLDDFLRAIWQPGPEPPPSGVPWEITMLSDSTARAAALDAYWSATQ